MEPSLADLERLRRALPETIYKRCRHVVGENGRVVEAVAALEQAPGAGREVWRVFATAAEAAADAEPAEPGAEVVRIKVARARGPQQQRAGQGHSW